MNRTRTFIISGQWMDGKPDYSLWEILPDPKYPSPDWTYDDKWRKRKLPEEEMRRQDIEAWLVLAHGKDCDVKRIESRNNGQEVLFAFVPHSGGTQT